MLDNTFHDYSVLNIRFQNNELILKILSEPDEETQTTLVFSDVKDVIVDGKTPSEKIGMLYPDGYILSINEDSNFVSIFIEWVNYKTRNFVTKSYEFKCYSIAVDSCPNDEAAR